jgi:hypothetical protein
MCGRDVEWPQDRLDDGEALKAVIKYCARLRGTTGNSDNG